MTAAEDLLAEARKETGLDHFGPDDFREGLEIYCESVFTEAQLNAVGVAAVRGNIVVNLANRLRVVDWATRHPDVVEQPIEAPVIVIGMFRAGTTYLSNLLDQDRRNRSLLRWEASDSVPPPTPANFRSGPRVEAARVGAELIEQLNPRVAAIHHEDVDSPTECIAVMSQDFKSLSWEAIANVPAYGHWLRHVDQRSAYAYHRLVLQVLQHGGVGGRWTLKSPHHAIALEALTTVYPDAHLVLLHRDPLVLCASVCSLITTLSGTFTDADHRRYIASHWVELLEMSISRIDAFRAAHPEHPVLDVQYGDLVTNPVDTVTRIYDHIGDRLTDETRRALTEYVATNGKGKFGVHTYNLDEFGLNEDELTERFASYVERHDIPPERSHAGVHLGH